MFWHQTAIHHKTFNFNYESEGKQHLKCVLELRPFVIAKIPEDGTLVPKLEENFVL
jgi:hypothetical protein